MTVQLRGKLYLEIKAIYAEHSVYRVEVSEAKEPQNKKSFKV